jgi:hypothetical protein
MIRRLLVVAIIFVTVPALVRVAPSLAQACEYWVAPAPEGSDSNPGTFSQPWATLEYASAQVLTLGGSNCTVWFKDGLYTGAYDLHERFSTPTTFKAINPYQVILQYSGLVLELSGARNMVFEGFEFRHSSPGATGLVVYVSRDDSLWAENITFRNNIFHDSYGNDLLKIANGSRFVTVENNVFYNQGASEQHMDVNSVTDVTIQDNLFFNDFAGSGRTNANNTKHFIVIKDSNDNTDGLEGSERVTVRRNLFLNWEGGIETFVQAGNDGKPYHEAKDVRLENNLMIGNAPNPIGHAFGVSGGRDITFTNNTVVGDLPSSAYAFRVSVKDLNPQNQNIYFYNNIWSDPTGTMGAGLSGSSNEFSDGDPAGVANLILDNNLYWNGGAAIPPGDLVSPLVADARRVVADPGLNTNQSAIVLPRWNGSAFLSGNTSIRQEFERLVQLYGQIPAGSPAIGQADPAFAPADDILGRPRGATRDLGAYEYDLSDTPTETPTPTDTPTPTLTPTPSNTPTPSATPTSSATPTPTPTATATSANTGFKSASANAAVSSGDGNGFETSPANAQADDGAFAVDTNSSTGTSNSCTNSKKDRHLFYNYDFGLPGGATILGIEVRLDAKVDSTSGSPKMCVELSWDGGVSWTAARSTLTLTTSEVTYLLGGASDTWGRTWSAADLNTNFRVRVTNVARSTVRDFSLDWVPVNVTYQ